MKKVPIILQDLPAKDTHRSICNSLISLQSAAEDIFERIRVAAEQERGTAIHFGGTLSLDVDDTSADLSDGMGMQRWCKVFQTGCHVLKGR